MTTSYNDNDNDNNSFLDWLQQRSAETFSLQESAHFVRQAADALQSVHNQRIVYQNVNPANFLILRREQPNLPNLQLANVSTLTSAAEPSGTNKSIPNNNPLYMAPEQWQGLSVLATDQYALAVMAYQLLTWHPLFQGTQEQVMQQHLHAQPQSSSSFNPHIPPALDAVVLHALAKKPQDRYPSVSAFASAFEQAVSTPNPVQEPSASSIPSTSNSGPNFKFPSRRSQGRELLLLAILFVVLVSSINFSFSTILKNNQAAINNPSFLLDPLSTNTNGRWPENANCLFKGGTYHVIESHARASQKCISSKLSFANISIQVDVLLLSGDTAELIFRANPQNAGASSYIFAIGRPQIFVFLRSHPERVIIQKAISFLALGERKNTLLVVAKGGNFKLYINGTFVGEGQDNAFTSGQIGFAAAAASTPRADASFSNLKIFKV